MRDLVQRIRDRPNDAPMPTEHLLEDAAEGLERLIAENESLRSQLQIANASISEAVHSLVDVSDRLKRAVEVRS